MTARDAATHADPTDEVASDDAATPAVDGPGSGATPATEVDAPSTDGTEADAAAETDDTKAGDTKAGDTKADDKAGDTAGDTAEPAADADGAGRTGRRRATRRRHRHASGDDADTTTTRPRRRRGRLVAAALVVAALFAGAMVGLYLVQRPDPVAGLSGSQQAAIDAATQAAVNLQTFRRASFDQDFANALASLTPEFASQQLEPRKDALKQQLESGGRDASATALSSGLVSSTATQAVVLVVTNTTQTADDGTSTPFVFSRLQLTLQYTGGKWLVSDLTSVGLS